jgi:hypothetical protein
VPTPHLQEQDARPEVTRLKTALSSATFGVSLDTIELSSFSIGQSSLRSHGAFTDHDIAFTPALAAAARKLLSSVAKGSLSRRAKSK